MNVRRCKTLTFSTAQIGTMLPVPWPTTTHLRLAVMADGRHRLSTGDLRVTTLPQAWKGAEGRDSYVVSSLRGSLAASRLPDTKRWLSPVSRQLRVPGEMKAVKNYEFKHQKVTACLRAQFSLGTAWLQHISPPLINCPAPACPEW